VISGVPQGTVLGPILFILYLNDLESCIKHSVISSFADDTRLKKSINNVHDTNLLQKDLLSACIWSDHSNMKLHQQKFELLCHSTDTSNLLKELPYSKEHFEYTSSDGTVISPTSAVTDLGVTITSDLTWSLHISNIVHDSRKMASWILSVFAGRNAELMMPLFKSLVRSRTEYCCPLWHPSKLEDIKKLEAVQRTYTAKIPEVQHLSYWDRLKSLNLMSLQRRRERYILIHVYKILHDLAPNDLQMQFYGTARRGTCCRVPPLVKNSKPKYQRQYDHSFRVIGAKLWNLLPKSVKVKETLGSYKCCLSNSSHSSLITLLFQA
jgi:ribonuclease P/MRP protein subunit RPP40